MLEEKLSDLKDFVGGVKVKTAAYALAVGIALVPLIDGCAIRTVTTRPDSSDGWVAGEGNCCREISCYDSREITCSVSQVSYSGTIYERCQCHSRTRSAAEIRYDGS